MGILDEDVARVRDAADFVQIASQHIALKRSGKRWTGLCPFHAEKSPSFSINPELNLYTCFGCQAKGDVITFVREVEHLDFVGAVERLAAATNIVLRYDDKVEGRDRQKKDRLTEAMERAVEWYHQRLLSSADASTARGYLRSRGYDGEIVRRFRIGYAPDDWDALSKALSLPDDVLRDSGLGFLNKRNRHQDAFRNRVMFPIFDTSGKPVAFGGRRLGDGEGPKYKNSPETPLYSKSRTLYGLNWAKEGVVQKGEVVVCEGYTDVIGFFLAGIPRAVATCGTALADEHFRMLKNFARRVVLAYDADSAGQAAAERFYEWEQRYEVDIAVAAFPAGADPADLARTDPDALQKAISEARPFLAFRLERVLRAGNLTTAEGRARAADAALGIVAEHPNPLVRDQYLMEVADRTRIEIDRLREGVNRPRKAAAVPTRSRRGGEAAPDEAGDERRAALRRNAAQAGPETEALRLRLHRPDEVAGALPEVLFADELHLAAIRALSATSSVHEAIEEADPAAAELIQRLGVEDVEVETEDVLRLLTRRAAERAVVDVENEARHSDDPTAWAPVMQWLKLAIERLEEPAEGIAAREALVAWLVERNQGDV